MKSELQMAVVTLCVMALAVLNAAAQDGSTEKRDETAKKVQKHWLKLSRKYANTFTLARIEEDPKPFELHDKPVFLHTQSVRGDDIGAVHLWLTEDRRPAVVGVVFAWSNSKTSRMVSYEMHSLVQQPVNLNLSGRVQWTSPTKGFEWKPFPEGTPAPAAKPLHRRLQVKQLARQFTANTTTDKNQRWELRAVPTPLYEYQSKTASVVHGAMFAFCQGTDTELLLLIEAWRDPEGDSEDQNSLAWRYGLAPFSDYRIRAKLDQEEVWESPPGELGQNGNPHYWNFLEQVPKPEFEIARD